MQSKGLSSFSNTMVQKHQFFRAQLSLVQLSYPYMTTGKKKTKQNITLTRWTFVGNVMSLLLNMLSRLVITFLPRSKHLLILWLQSLSTVILEPPNRKSITASTFSASICYEVIGPGAMILSCFFGCASSSLLCGLFSSCSKWGLLSSWCASFSLLQKEMAPRSSVLAWRIPGTGEPGGLLSVGSHRVGHD